ncbi:hypothetical protein LCGC14_0677360 [marine sediment metagenome]|uniref:Multi-ubiquitin domain-containing protein n=1 Tax=marine sediment metagenome TaxID=412755 RepID=A0A0F9R9I4_9ZZZZ
MIYINAVKTVWEYSDISYEQAVELAGKDPTKQFTLQYSYRNNRGGGTLIFGEMTEVEDKMSIDVTRTDNA